MPTFAPAVLSTVTKVLYTSARARRMIMSIGEVLAHLPVAAFLALAMRGWARGGARDAFDRFPGTLPRDWKVSQVCESLAAATEAYAAYLSSRRGVLDPDEQQMLDEDLSKARAAMERARLEATLVRPPAKR
jgi:hypothetical protein